MQSDFIGVAADHVEIPGGITGCEQFNVNAEHVVVDAEKCPGDAGTVLEEIRSECPVVFLYFAFRMFQLEYDRFQTEGACPFAESDLPGAECGVSGIGVEKRHFPVAVRSEIFGRDRTDCRVVVEDVVEPVLLVRVVAETPDRRQIGQRLAESRRRFRRGRL